MDAFTRQDFERLARHRNAWCVSLYLPTDRHANGFLQVPIRIKNLSATAETMLVEHGLRAPEARRLLEPIRELANNEAFIRGIINGMAIFLDESGMQTYRLPERFEEQVVVGTRFYIKPLLPLVVAEGRFLLLAVSANSVRMFEGDRWRIKKLNLPDVPRNMEEALHFDEPQELRQAHTMSFGGHGGTRLAFHGQGGAPDAAKDERMEFFRYLDRALRKHLRDEHAPLIFAGVDYMFPLFKKTSSYKHITEKPIVGNTELLGPDQLREAAWEIAEPIFAEERKEALARSHRVAGTDHGLLSLEMVLQACWLGQVDTLLVDTKEACWGRFDPEAGEVHRDEGPRPGNEDLLDLAIALTVGNSGWAYPADCDELPDHNAVAAVLRYPWNPTAHPRVAAASR